MSENKIEVKSGEHTIQLNPSITYAQDQAILGVYLEENITRAQITAKADRLGIECTVYSIDGDTANIYERFLKLPLADARVFVKALKAILDPKAPVPVTKE